MKHRERETQGERHIGRDIMTQWEKEIQTQGERHKRHTGRET